jgi:hypothetical protein
LVTAYQFNAQQQTTINQILKINHGHKNTEKVPAGQNYGLKIYGREIWRAVVCIFAPLLVQYY